MKPSIDLKKNNGLKIRTQKFLNTDRLVGSAFFFGCGLTLFITSAIIFFLFRESFLFFQNVSILDFLTGLEWSPLIEPRRYGVIPLAVGTIQITLWASVLALPLGLLVALYLSEYASKPTRGWMKPLLDLLAGIPSVVYGFFAVSYLTPFLQKIFPKMDFFNGMSAGLVVGIMILPLVTSLAEESLRAVPKDLRRSARALGAKDFQVAIGILLPAASPGIIAAFIIGVSRAIGETMAVTLAAGSNPNLTWSPLEGVQTLTAYIAQISMGDTPADSVEYFSMYSVACVLFVITFGMNAFARVVVKRTRLHHG